MAINKKNPLLWNGKQYNKFLIIENHDIHTGFCALIIYVLNGVRKASARNAIPVINFNGRNTCYLYDKSKGESVWDYFFQPLNPFTVAQLEDWLEAGILKEEDVEKLSAEEFGYSHHHDPDRLATFWAWETPHNKADWMREKRLLGRRYIQRYVHPKDNVVEMVDDFCRTHFTAKKVFGLHIRGTDFNYATPIAINTYMEKLDTLISQYSDENYRVFVATDQQQYLDKFSERYGSKVISREVLRSTNHIVPVKLNTISGYQKGEEALIDMLILSRCDHIIKGPAALGEMSLWFTEQAGITDLAPECDFQTKHYSQLDSSYAVLNIDSFNPSQLFWHKLKEKLVKFLYSWKVVAYFYKRSERVRQWLQH